MLEPLITKNSDSGEDAESFQKANDETFGCEWLWILNE